MSEVGTVDDDEHVGPCSHHRGNGLPDQAQDLRQLLDHGGKADDRQLFNRKQRLQALSRHCEPTDTFECNGIAEALAKHLHQMRAQPIAGFLCCDQKNLARDPAICGRRHQEARPVTKRPASSAASIMACASATTVFPATTATPESPAAAAPSTVRGPMAGKS